MCRSGEGSERFARVVVAVSALYSVRKGETIPILLVKKGNFRCKHGRKGTEQQEKEAANANGIIGVKSEQYTVLLSLHGDRSSGVRTRTDPVKS